MSQKILVSKYTPTYEELALPWYERDGLLTYIDPLKWKEFINDPHSHFFNAEVINFDIIHNRCRGDELKYFVKYYKTVDNKDFNNYPDKDEKKALSAAARKGREDHWVKET